VLAQSRDVSQYGHTTGTARQGFLNAGIVAGSHSGLVHWDGHRLVPNECTAGQLITALSEDREGKIRASTGRQPGRLWVSASSGAWRWQPDRAQVGGFRRPRPLASLAADGCKERRECGA